MKWIILLPSLLISTLLFAQNDTSSYPYWIDMMKNGERDFSKIQSAFETYWNGRSIDKGSGYKPFKRWEYRMSKRVDDNGMLPPKNYIHSAMQGLNIEKSLTGNWKPLGPNFNQTTPYGDIAGTGRLNTVGFHPTDPNTYYVGAPAGALWKTTDNGISWENLTDHLPTLGVSAVLVDRDDPNRVYIGTGDRDANDAEGLGVFISTDGGATWTQSITGMGEIKVNEFRQHPDSSNVIYAACEGGFYRSDDNGANWSKRTLINGFYEDIEINPADPSIILTVGSARIYRSTDYGMTWSNVTGLPIVNRLLITVSEADPNRVYALLCNQRSLYSFRRSDDGGQTFYEVMDYPNIMGYERDGSDVTGGQAWYDACMVADPLDADIVYVGGIHVFKTMNGGVDWEYSSEGVHVDMHYLAFSPLTHDIVLCNDGGVYKSSNDALSWTDVSANIVVGQMYKLGQAQQQHDLVLTGFQDNGTAKFNGVNWDRFSGADGMECQISNKNTDYMYSTYQYGSIRRSVNGGASQQRVGATGENGINEDGAWVTPFTLPEHTDTAMFAGYQSVWRTDNIKEPDNDDVVWTKISTAMGNANDEFTVLEHSPADTNLLYAYKNGNQVYRSDNCMDATGAVTWTAVTVNSGSGNVNDLEAHPTMPDVVYATRGTNVLVSLNRGANWTNITNNLPAITFTDIAYDTSVSGGLYVGSVAGVWYIDSSMTQWIQFSTGLPPAIEVSEIEIFYGATPTDKRIRASTYGRGLWESDGYGSITTNFPTTPLLTLNEENPKHLVRGDFDVYCEFYKNLNVHAVTGFDPVDVVVTNGTLNNLNAFNDGFLLNITPTNQGIVTIQIVQDAATDGDGVLSLESEILEVYYSEEIPQLGIYGPGGVGNLDEIALWLDAAYGLKDPNGVDVSSSYEALGSWADKSAQSVAVEQSSTIRYPYFLSGADGINGLPAVGFEPDSVLAAGDNFLATDVRVGKNFAGFWALQSNTSLYNNHGWVMSGRNDNGFVMHPVNNSRNIYMSVINDNGGYWSGSSHGVEDVLAPHIHSYAYCENDVKRYLMSGLDGVDIEDDGDMGSLRSNTTLSDFSIGWDYNNRYGDAKIGEQVLYNEELGITHVNIVRNYFSSKFGVPLSANDLYAFDDYHKHDVAGIGRTNEYDYHYDALGTGIIRMKTSSIVTDSTYLLWGDNAGDISTWSAIDVPFELQRLSRQWRVDETGDISSISILVSNADLPYTDQSLGVLVSNTADFSSGNYVYTLGNYSGDTLSTFTDLEKGQYFTIVTGDDDQFNLVNESYAGLSVTAYPSLATDYFDVYVRDIGDITGDLSIYDEAGRKVRTIRMNGSKTVIQRIANLSGGSYTIRFEGEGTAYTRVVVVD